MLTPDQLEILVQRCEALQVDLDSIAQQIQAVTETALEPDTDVAYTAERLKSLKLELEAREASIASEVLSELADGMSNRLKWTNETTRKAEIKRRSSIDPELQELRMQADRLSTDRLNAAIRQSQVEKRIAALQTVANLKCAKAALLTQLLTLGDKDPLT